MLGRTVSGLTFGTIVLRLLLIAHHTFLSLICIPKVVELLLLVVAHILLMVSSSGELLYEWIAGMGVID
jgi:hypothetical protein